MSQSAFRRRVRSRRSCGSGQMSVRSRASRDIEANEAVSPEWQHRINLQARERAWIPQGEGTAKRQWATCRAEAFADQGGVELISPPRVSALLPGPVASSCVLCGPELSLIQLASQDRSQAVLFLLHSSTLSSRACSTGTLFALTPTRRSSVRLRICSTAEL